MGSKSTKILNLGNISAKCELVALFHCTFSFPLKQLKCDGTSNKLGLGNDLLLQLSRVMVGVLRMKRMCKEVLRSSSPE